MMESSVKERIKMFLKEANIKGVDFCETIGVSSGFIAGMRESIQPDKIKSIAINYPMLDIGWLMTGEGEMLKTSNNLIGSNQGSGNAKVGSNIGNNYSNAGIGNTVNVTLPKSGIQKIIKPNGVVELSSSDSNNDEFEQLKRDYELIKVEVSYLKDRIVLKDDLIASLKETIELLRHRQ